jgi:hypothetical protein
VRTIATELVKPRHAYTSEDVPWQMDDDGGSALFRYLRGGGVRAFGRTSVQAARERRQSRFLILFGVAAAAWFLLWIF